MRIRTILLSAALMIVACPTASNAVSASKVVANCSSGSTRPGVLRLACPHLYPRVNRLHWTTWGTSTATGTGTFASNHNGKITGYAASVTLTAPTKAGYFSRATIKFGAHHPVGITTRSFSLVAPKGAIGYGTLVEASGTGAESSVGYFHAITPHVFISYYFDCSNEDTTDPYTGYSSQGYDNFIVHIRDALTDDVDAFAVNDLGNGSAGSGTVDLPYSSGDYYLEVTTGCNWDISVLGYKHV